MGTPLGAAMENGDTREAIAYAEAVGIPHGNKALGPWEKTLHVSGGPITPVSTRSIDSSSHSFPTSRQPSGATTCP